MKKISDEKGAAQLIEAAIIYPVVFMIIFFLIYLGLYVLQIITIDTYAQKIAVITAKEIAHPGYISQVGSDSIDDVSAELSDTSINIPDNTNMKLYRYIFGNLIDDEQKKTLENTLEKLVSVSSIIGSGEENIQTSIECKNYFFVQDVKVTVKQKLPSFVVLEFFGIESPEISTTAVATVNDTDEFIRNVDFVYNVVNTIADKLGIDIKNIRNNINSALKKIGIGS